MYIPAAQTIQWQNVLKIDITTSPDSTASPDVGRGCPAPHPSHPHVVRGFI